MERWTVDYTNRSAMLGEMPTRRTTVTLEAETEGLAEQEIVELLHHLVDERTEGAGVLTGAERAEPDTGTAD